GLAEGIARGSAAGFEAAFALALLLQTKHEPKLLRIALTQTRLARPDFVARRFDGARLLQHVEFVAHRLAGRFEFRAVGFLECLGRLGKVTAERTILFSAKF